MIAVIMTLLGFIGLMVCLVGVAWATAGAWAVVLVVSLTLFLLGLGFLE